MIRINLLPVRQKAKEENVRRQITMGAVLLFIFLAAIGYILYDQYSQLSRLRDQKAQAEQKLAALKKEVGDLEQFKKKKQALENRKAAIADLNRNRQGVVKALDQLINEKPKELYFVSLEQKSSGAPWDNFSLSITGVATDNEVVAKFMKGLQASKKTFPSVDLDFTKAKVVQKDVGAYQEFHMDVQVAQEKPPQASKPEPPGGKAQPQPPKAPGGKKS
ncbi:MAG: PilN domain-containing protein [bacterium]